MNIRFKAPGRVVFFGEHQDYLNLPVIPAAVDLYMNIEGKRSHSHKFHIELPDVQRKEIFSSRNIKYNKPRDYLKSGVKVLQKAGIIPEDEGVIARITSNIPMKVGLSSSSALCVIWIAFLADTFNHKLTPNEITRHAHQSEVIEFNEPGGMQDHMAISHGYLNYEEFNPIKCTRLMKEIPGIVIGNSMERKDTLNTLASIKSGVKKGLEFLEVSHIRDLTMTDIRNVKPVKGHLDEYSLNTIKAAIINYEITREAYLEFKKGFLAIDHEYIGELMTKHHASLRDYLQVSTPKLEVMIQAAIKAGALGCKVTGSGNGGCMIAYSPGREKEVSFALEKVGGESHIAKVVPGVSNLNTVD
ncbi:MAG: mevalonate kinase [Candidatus Hodarchaeota archaeon]